MKDENAAYRADLCRRLAEVREEMATAAVCSGRSPEAVRLVAVTKMQPATVLQAAVRAGIGVIGENYVQEAADKFTELGWTADVGSAPVERHFIGHLQGNKVRTAVQWFDLIQTIDSVALAARVDRLAGETGRRVPVLVQINISGESTKAGISPDEVEGILCRLANLAHIRVRGLMTIGSFDLDPTRARAEFTAMRSLRDRLRPLVPAEIALDELSMGMSHDFTIAIEEGATLVRVGSRLFGPRPAHR